MEYENLYDDKSYCDKQKQNCIDVLIQNEIKRLERECDSDIVIDRIAKILPEDYIYKNDGYIQTLIHKDPVNDLILLKYPHKEYLKQVDYLAQRIAIKVCSNYVMETDALNELRQNLFNKHQGKLYQLKDGKKGKTVRRELNDYLNNIKDNWRPDSDSDSIYSWLCATNKSAFNENDINWLIDFLIQARIFYDHHDKLFRMRGKPYNY